MEKAVKYGKVASASKKAVVYGKVASAKVKAVRYGSVSDKHNKFKGSHAKFGEY